MDTSIRAVSQRLLQTGLTIAERCYPTGVCDWGSLMDSGSVLQGEAASLYLQADFFFGFERIGQVQIATPEKALIDALHLTPTKSQLFKTFSEIDFPKTFSFKKANAIINKIPSARIKTLARKRLNDLMPAFNKGS